MADPSKVRGTICPINQGSAGSKNRRKHARYQVDTSAALHLIGIAAVMGGRILNLSLGGCCIRMEQRFSLGIYRRVEIEFRVDGIPIRLGGVIQAIHDPLNIGIRFLDMSERKREQLVQLIGEIEESRERGSVEGVEG